LRHNRRFRHGILGAVLLFTPALFIVAYAPAAGADYKGCNQRISTSTPAPGQNVTVSAVGDCFLPNSQVTVTIDCSTSSLGTFTARGATFTATVTIPSDCPLGEHTIKVSGTNVFSGKQVLSYPVTIGGVQVLGNEVTNATGTGTGATETGTGLPFTGNSGTGMLLGIVAALMVMGAGLVVGARRRSARTTL
jgi:hypothetical protein